MKKKITLIIVLLLIAGCSEMYPDFDNGSDSNRSSPSQVATQETYDMDTEYDASVEGSSAAMVDQSVINTANVTYETINYDQAKKNLLALITDNTIIEYQTESNYSLDSQDLKDFNLTLRVPQGEFEDYIESLEGLEEADLRQMTQGSDNVTKAIQDNELKLQTVENRIDRLDELNKKATTVSEIIEIETALNSAIYERDQILSDQAFLEDQVDMSTITIQLMEVLQLKDGTGSQVSWWEKLSDYFAELWEYVKIALSYGIITIFYLIPLVILALIIKWLFKRKK